MGKDVIVACDFPSKERVIDFLDGFTDRKPFVKIGMELFYAEGPQIVREIKARGHKIFLDLKLHDIPNTVASALAVLTELGADMMNVHAIGGRKMMQEAVKAVHAKAAELGRPAPKLIAVTILTSINEEQYADLNYKTGIAEQVIALAKLAKEAGMDGVVASPQEAAAIREACGEGFLIVTPGIRPAGSDVNDQSRIATPSGALKNGSTHIVVGRPITKAEDKKAAAQSIAAEIRGV